jgi:hypothetical protein
VASYNPHFRLCLEWVQNLNIAATNVIDISGDQNEPVNTRRRSQRPVALVLLLRAEQARPLRRHPLVDGDNAGAIRGLERIQLGQLLVGQSGLALPPALSTLAASRRRS